MGMTRRALLIGNSRAAAGVHIDLENYTRFLQALIGGAWEAEEIRLLLDQTPAQILRQVALVKKDAVDYLVIIYSGHGGQLRKTLLEVNPKGDTLLERELHGLAERQLNIYDACQVRPVGVLEAKRSRDFALLHAHGDRAQARAVLEKRIMAAISQEVCLYACKPGQTASSTAEGGVYSRHLLNAAYQMAGLQEVTVRQAHQKAWSASILQTKSSGRLQEPEAYFPPCFAPQDLVLSLQP